MGYSDFCEDRRVPQSEAACSAARLMTTTEETQPSHGQEKQSGPGSHARNSDKCFKVPGNHGLWRWLMGKVTAAYTKGPEFRTPTSTEKTWLCLL